MPSASVVPTAPSSSAASENARAGATASALAFPGADVPSSAPFLPALRIPLRPSRLLWLALILVHCLPFGVLIAPQLPWSARVISAAMTAVSAALAWRTLRRTRRAALLFAGDGMALEGGDVEKPLERLAWVALGPLRALSLHFPDARPWHGVVLRDGLSAEAWRRFDVQLRWGAARRVVEGKGLDASL